MLVISDGGLRSIKPFPPQPLSHCVFEHVYFARPDSYVFGRSVNEVRTELGRILAREAPADADVVVPIPDSGVCAAIGFAEEAGLPMRMGLIRNHYVGRTFIQPQQSIRHFSVRVKLNPVRSILEGKRVILLDDSIVRGTTSRKIVKMVKAAGAREVHLRISCPPTISPCFYGVDTPSRSELIAATHTIEEIRKYVEADSLAYLSLEGLRAAVGTAADARTARPATPASIRSPSRANEHAYLQLALKVDRLNTPMRPSSAPTPAGGLRAVVARPRRRSRLAAGAAAGRRRRRQEPRASRRSRRSRCRRRSTSSATVDFPIAPRPPAPSAGAGRRWPCRRCSRRSQRTPTGTSASARSSCSPASTIPRTRDVMARR